MANSSTISSKGQVTVPIEVRRRLGLQSGDRVEFIEENGRTVLQPVRGETNPFEKWVGALSYFSSVNEINEWVAEMRSDEETEDSPHRMKDRTL